MFYLLNVRILLGCDCSGRSSCKGGPHFPRTLRSTLLAAREEIGKKRVLEAESDFRGRTSVSILAVQHIRRMRGGAQAHLMRCSDGHFYVVKFRNNPQHLRVLANEMLATRLAERVGLPVPATAMVEVDEWLIRHSPELCVQLAHSTVPCEPGLQFGSRYAVDPWQGQIFDYLPLDMLSYVRNLHTFAGMLVFDKWTGNADGRQAAFWKLRRERKYTTTFIDQGYCFNAGEWTFPDHPLRGVYARNEVYERVRNWGSFEPWLSRVETMADDFVWNLAGEIPPDWYGGSWDAFGSMVQRLLERRAIVRDLIEAFRVSPRRPFPAWSARIEQISPNTRHQNRRVS
jgi:hypothetical protein